MDELERRLIRVEEQMVRMAEGMERVERSLERVATILEQQAEMRAAYELQQREIHRLRDASHRHAQMLEHIPMIEHRLDQLVAEMGSVRGGLADVRALATRAAAVSAVGATLLALLIRWGLG